MCFLYKANKNFFKRNQVDAGTKDEVLDLQKDLEDFKMSDKLKEDYSKSKHESFFKDVKSTVKKTEKGANNQVDLTEKQQNNPETKEAIEKSQANQKESNQKPNKQEEQVINPL